MFQFAFPAALFQLRARGPVIKPLLQLPKRRATAQSDACSLPCYLCRTYKFSTSGGITLRVPPGPLNGYADRWQKKIGGREAPVRNPGSTVPNAGARARNQTVVATTEAKGDRRERSRWIMSPQTIAAPSCGTSSFHFSGRNRSVS